jgi:hypothetical protein
MGFIDGELVTERQILTHQTEDLTATASSKPKITQAQHQTQQTKH